MSKPSILIVGAGAMGLVTGYHLNLGGAQITFLVRPGRIEAFSPPQTLYCYNDASLKNFADYRVIDHAAKMAGQSFDFVLVTLDGATSRSEEGTAVLRGIGEAIRKTNAMAMMGAVGVGLREHYLSATGLPENRLFNCILGLLSHQVTAGLPLHAPTDPAMLAKAGIAYRYSSSKTGLLVETRIPEAAREFASIYNRCGISRCVLMNKTLVSIITNSVFPILAASEIAGWPDISTLVANKELWHLACLAQGEIATLPRHGWMGKLMKLIMSDRSSAKMQLKMEKEMLPLDYQAFNRFHHGGKVRAQNIEVMRNCAAEGNSQDRPMTALKELLAQLDAHQGTH